jgi:O-antigen biosynthesis protein
MEMEIALNSLNEPFVSIIIPVYNARGVIEDCLNSVFSIDYNNFEVIVVDDCSKDKSADFIQKRYPQVKVLRRKKNYGFAGAVNIGLQNARGKIVVLLNMDTIVYKGWLKPLVDALIADKTIGLVGSKILSVDRITLQHAGGLLFENGLSVHIGRGELTLTIYAGHHWGLICPFLKKLDFLMRDSGLYITKIRIWLTERKSTG